MSPTMLEFLHVDTFSQKAQFTHCYEYNLFFSELAQKAHLTTSVCKSREGCTILFLYL